MMTVTLARRSILVDSFADAAARVRRYVAGRGIGSSAYASGGHGGIRFDGEQVARVSYNGRVWCERCDGEIDGDPREQFPARPCECGNTDRARALP